MPTYSWNEFCVTFLDTGDIIFFKSINNILNSYIDELTINNRNKLKTTIFDKGEISLFFMLEAHINIWWWDIIVCRCTEIISPIPLQDVAVEDRSPPESYTTRWNHLSIKSLSFFVLGWVNISSKYFSTFLTSLPNVFEHV